MRAADERTHHPCASPSTVRTEWTVEKGTYKGTKIAVSLIAGFDTAPDGSSFLSRASFQSGNSKEFGYERFSRSEKSYPIKTVFDRTLTTSALTATDSMNLWNIQIAAREEKYGRDLYTPGERILGSKDQLIVYIWSNARPAGGGTSSTADPLSLTGGIYAAIATTRFTNAFDFDHGAGHIEGYGHSCAWSGVMFSNCPPSSKDIDYPEPEKDVGYFEFRMKADDVRRSIKAKYHWGENLNGERKERSLPSERIRYGSYYTTLTTQQ